MTRYIPPLNDDASGFVFDLRPLPKGPLAVHGERASRYVYSHHAEIERRADGLTFAQVEEALLGGEILEQYPNTARGESCLVVGFAGAVPVHVVCGWRGDKVALITVYIPRAPKFVDPWTRGERTDVEDSM